VVAPSYVGLGVGIVLGNAMAGAGATKTTFAIDAFVVLGVQVPLSVLAVTSFGGTLPGLFRCVAVTNGVSALTYALVYARGRWVAAARLAA
jgi:Na+-driven multidrug efflux pump